QPLVLLAFPLLAAVVEPRRLPGYVARAAAPGALLLAAAATANWTATAHAVTSQPNYPAIDHPTPWIYLAPHIADGQVAAGPGRILAIVAALGCALVVARRWRAIRTAGRWGPGALTELLWWTAVALALRSAVEPVMVSYYLWPPPPPRATGHACSRSGAPPWGSRSSRRSSGITRGAGGRRWSPGWPWPCSSPGPGRADPGPAEPGPLRRCSQRRGSSSPPTARHDAISPSDSVVTGLASDAASAAR